MKSKRLFPIFQSFADHCGNSRIVPVLLLSLMMAVMGYAPADEIAGTVDNPEPRFPGAFRARFPATATVRVRDVFQVRHGSSTLGEAIAVEVTAPYVILMPKAGFHGTMSRGDTAIFVRHAADPVSISARRIYRAYSKRLQLRLVSPKPSDDLIFEDEWIRMKFDVESGRLWMEARSKTVAPIKIYWQQTTVVDTEGVTLFVVPYYEGVVKGAYPKLPTVILPHDSLQEFLCPMSVNNGTVAYQPIINSNLEDGKTRTFSLHIILVTSGANNKYTFAFSAALVECSAWLGLNVRVATEEEKDDLPRQYRQALIVTEVAPNGPAWKAGLILGDQIVECDNIALESRASFYAQVARKSGGDSIMLNVLRRGRSETFRVTLGVTR